MDGRSLSAPSTSRQSSRPISAANSAPGTPRLKTTLRTSSLESSRIFAPNASIVLVGIRGSGKTSLGYICARALGRRLVESDDEFERKTGCSRAQFLKRNGQNAEEYRMQERQVVESMLVNNENDAVIVCGVGSLESGGQMLLKKFALTHPVIHIVRAPEYIRQWLRIPMESSLTQRLEESDRAHRLCSNFEFYNLFDGGTVPGSEGTNTSTTGSQSPRYTSMLQRLQEDFIRFVNLIMGFTDDHLRLLGSKIASASAAPIDRIYTYALTIALSQLLSDDLNIVELDCGPDAIELHIKASDVEGLSLTYDSPWIAKLSEQFAVLRRFITAPIIFHVDRNTFLSNTAQPQDEAYLELLHLGLRMGAEFVTVNTDLEEPLLEQLRRSKGSTAFIGDYMDLNPSKLGWDDPSRLQRYAKATRLGCEIVRMSQIASVDEDNIAVRRFVQQATFKDDSKPLIAYNTGRLGRVSMCYNTILTPVTHTLFRTGSALKDQDSLLNLQEISSLTYDLGLLNPLQYWLFGANIEYSLSPALHNAGYAACGLPHNYRIHQASKFEEIEVLLQDPLFGGCSVSLPYKTEALKRVNSMSPEAQAIGAANTIIPIRSSKKLGNNVLSRAGKNVGFRGENTDWVAIMIVIRRNLTPANLIRSVTSGLVIGAGGMARAAIYALIRLDVPNIFIYNRTPANAEKVTAHFREVTRNMHKPPRPNARPVRHQFIVIKSLDDPWPNKHYEQPTIIVSCIPAHQIGDSPAPNLNIPAPWLQSVNGGVIVEIAYKPLLTPLMAQVQRLRESGRPWVLASGIEVLPEQAMAQFQFMTGRIAPRHTIRQLNFPQIMNRKIDYTQM